jgi:hypothetical protein
MASFAPNLITPFLLLLLSTSVSAEPIISELYRLPSLLKAHGTIMGVAFTLLFPIGAILIRIPHKSAAKLHMACQLLGYTLTIIGLALGTRTGLIIDLVSYLFSKTSLQPPSKPTN